MIFLNLNNCFLKFRCTTGIKLKENLEKKIAQEKANEVIIEDESDGKTLNKDLNAVFIEEEFGEQKKKKTFKF